MSTEPTAQTVQVSGIDPIEPTEVLPGPHAQPPQPDGPSVKDMARTVTLAKVGSELFDEATAETRKALLDALLELRKETGTKSLIVEFDGVGKVATISLSEPKDRIVIVDREAFVEWIEDTQPPGTVTYEPVINDAWYKGFTENDVTLDTDAGTVLLPSETGEVTVVPGLKSIPAAAPTSFSVRFDAAPKQKKGEPPKMGGRQKVAALLTGESIASLLDASAPAAPAIEAGAA